eukprot:TRINITY_DN9402_c0_g1_i1.p1 TRINITY_DN9402_c0_g1~~TRINITY_DN9402_c0_g1_i1.p1  ORF type:complete len:255 (+),score=49.09 TRINITY_DN9402_c0_g1_i1:130-894(+)
MNAVCPSLCEIKRCPSYHAAVPAIAGWLRKMSVSRHDAVATVFSCPKKYMSAAPAVDCFLYRLVRYMCCSAEVFVHAVVYMLRYMQRVRAGTSQQSVHRLLAASVVVGIKHLDDKTYTNTYYARVCGVTLGELNALERELLLVLDFDVLVSFTAYNAMVKCFECSAFDPEEATAAERRPLSPSLSDRSGRSSVSMGYTSAGSDAGGGAMATSPHGSAGASPRDCRRAGHQQTCDGASEPKPQLRFRSYSVKAVC